MNNMRNMYAGNCFLCPKRVEKGEGFFQSVGSLPKQDRLKYVGKGKWLLRCQNCVGVGNKLKANIK